MEIISTSPATKPVKAVLFDFDGTLSTLRHGWNTVMKKMMLDMISGSDDPEPELVEEVENYIALSTGLQTIHQMQWLADAVRRCGGMPGADKDPWWYKAEFNKRLMEMVDVRKQALSSGSRKSEEFLIKGSRELLSAFKQRDLQLFVASGTDLEDVKKEAELLGVNEYFDEISGAPLGKIECPKTILLNRILKAGRVAPDELAVFGDGPVELELARKAGALAVGVASDEDKLYGINPAKHKRLVNAGAHAIIGDYGNISEIIELLRLS